jgi:hypothetical protein
MVRSRSRKCSAPSRDGERIRLDAIRAEIDVIEMAIDGKWSAAHEAHL